MKRAEFIAKVTKILEGKAKELGYPTHFDFIRRGRYWFVMVAGRKMLSVCIFQPSFRYPRKELKKTNMIACNIYRIADFTKRYVEAMSRVTARGIYWVFEADSFFQLYLHPSEFLAELKNTKYFISQGRKNVELLIPLHPCIEYVLLHMPEKKEALYDDNTICFILFILFTTP